MTECEWWFWVVSVSAAVCYVGWGVTLFVLGLLLHGRRQEPRP